MNKLCISFEDHDEMLRLSKEIETEAQKNMAQKDPSVQTLCYQLGVVHGLCSKLRNLLIFAPLESQLEE